MKGLILADIQLYFFSFFLLCAIIFKTLCEKIKNFGTKDFSFRIIRKKEERIFILLQRDEIRKNSSSSSSFIFYLFL